MSLIEHLETRLFMSAAPSHVAPVAAHAAPRPAHVLPALAGAAVIPSLVGAYSGTSATKYGREYILLKITSQDSIGRFTGVLTNRNHVSVSLAITGQVAANGKFTFSFSGTDYAGRATGSGFGKLTNNGKTLSTYYMENWFREDFSGRFTVRRQ